MSYVGSVRRLGAVIAVVTAATAAMLWAASLAGASQVTPELLTGGSNSGKRCNDLEGPGQDWRELKVDPNGDGTFTDGTLSVTIGNTQDDKVFDWTSNLGVDGVVAKGGSGGSYFYRYDPPQELTSDTSLTTPGSGANDISHISFCYDVVTRILVRKQTNPGGDQQSFAFTAGYGSFSLADGQSADSGNLQPGTYSVSETVPAGWDLASATCDDGSSPSSIDLGADETVTCTFVNAKRGKVVVVKQTDPDGDQQSFSFDASYDGDGFSLADGQQSDSGLLAPGTYSVSENVPAGWALMSATCDDGSSPSSIDLGAGETVTCTFTNGRQGKVVVVKQTNPDGDQQTFSFSASYDGNGFSLADGQQDDSGLLAPGTYSVSENVPAGWAQSSATCNDGSSPSSIALGAGETVTCTFTNVKQGQVVVRKVMVGGTGSFDFTGTPSGTISQNGGTISATVAPGEHSSTESVPSGWDLTDVDCDDSNSTGNLGQATASFVVAPGEVVTCTFTNTKQVGTIVVEKQTLPNGDPQAFSFTASYDQDGFTLSDDQESSSGPLDPGTYSVAENVPAGWDLTSVECDDESSPDAIDLDAAETVRCVFTNTKSGSIVVEKQTTPDGDPQLFAFTASYDADGFSLADGQQSDSGVLAPGTYSVSEVVPAGWDLESAVCSDGSPASAIALAAGESVTCVFTNEKDARIVVEKQTQPNGDPTAFQFTASYDADGFFLADGQQSDSGDLDPGSYSVAETVPQGWDLLSAVCDDQSDPSSIALEAGETVTCVFTNEKDARIVVQKQTDPDGDPKAFHFDASYDQGGFNLADNQQSDSGDLAPGTYSVSEDVPAGWMLASAVCSDLSDPASIALEAGETVTCVFSNTKLASIVVEKQTVPDGAGDVFTFTGDAAGSVADDGRIVVGSLAPGTYTSTEAAAEGWNLTSIACSDANSTGSLDTRTATFRVEAGETVECTFTNLEPAPLGRGAIDVQKTADPTTLEEPGGPVSFTVTVTNVSNVQVGIESVVDDRFGSLEEVAGGNPSECFDLPVYLAPFERVTCTFPKTVTGPGGTVHVNTVEVKGHDEHGNEVADSDDARVEITARLIDLVLVKEATSPTPLDGIVDYTLTVTNRGPNDATNVQVADPAPAGIAYLTASSSRGTCNVVPALVTCSLGTVAKGESVTIRLTARATAAGRHVNVATVTGGGGRETNPADNVDDAVTIVVSPLRPPVVKPVKPQPAQVETCLTLTVTPKMLKADGKADRVTVKVTAGGKRVRGTRVSVTGAGVRATGRSNGKGVAVVLVNPRKPGLITVTAVETDQRVCGTKRIGVVGVFLPPLAG
jgi:uncharacterized repeat protein (TIGR01451 family)